jgi:hypothetical protein
MDGLVDCVGEGNWWEIEKGRGSCTIRHDLASVLLYALE